MRTADECCSFKNNLSSMISFTLGPFVVGIYPEIFNNEKCDVDGDFIIFKFFRPICIYRYFYILI